MTLVIDDRGDIDKSRDGWGQRTPPRVKADFVAANLHSGYTSQSQCTIMHYNALFLS